MASTPDVPQAKAVAWWKRWLVFGAGAGAAFAVTLAVIVGGFLWRESRPKPPKPWDTKAITASFGSIDTEGEKNILVFYYTLENSADSDYRSPDGAGVSIAGRLKREQSLSIARGAISLDYPVFVPAHQRVLFALHLSGYPCTEPLPPPGAERRADLSAYVAKEMPNLDGFVLFDEANRYQINFPKGW
jgi:hypothetical protein